MFLKNTSIYFAGELISRVAKLASIYFVAALLPKAEFGRYSFILALALIVLVFFDFGMNTLIMLRTSWRRFERLAPFFIVEKLAVVLFTSSVTVLLAFVFHPFGASTQLVFSFALLCIGWDLQAFSSNALRSVLNFSGEFWTKSLGATGFPVVLAVTGLTGGSLSVPQLCLLQGGFLLVAGFAGVLLLRRNVPSLVPPRRHIRRGLLALGKIGAPLTLAASAGVLQTSIDSIVLGSKNLLETNASFTLVNRLGQIVQLPVNIVMFAALPYIVDKLDRGRRAPDGSLLRLATKILVSSACAAAQIFILAVVVAVPALLGDKYSDVRIFGEVLGLYIVPLYLYPFFFNLMSAMRNVIGSQIIYGVSTLFNMILDLVAISFFGPMAIAWVPVLVYWLLLFAALIYFRKRNGYWPFGLSEAVLAFFGQATILAPYLTWTSGSVREVAARLLLASFWIAIFVFIFLREKTLFRQILSPERKAQRETNA